MNLQKLIEWANHEKDLKNLRLKTRKEGDINICGNLLGEIVKRCMLIIELTKKSERNMSDIQQFLQELDKRGVKVDLPEETIKEEPVPEKEPLKVEVSRASKENSDHKHYERELPRPR